MILSNKRIKVLIRLRRCAVWSALLLFGNLKDIGFLALRPILILHFVDSKQCGFFNQDFHCIEFYAVYLRYSYRCYTSIYNKLTKFEQLGSFGP